MEENKIFVIIVTYNGMKWIDACLKSVYDSSLPVEIILIDNCSNDETLSFIKSNFPSIILFEEKVNLGFGKANNIGMTYALKNKADFVFLLNQDTLILKGTIEDLVSTSIKNPNYAILSPVQLDYSGHSLEHYFFQFMGKDFSRSFYSDFVLGKSIKDIYDIDFVQAAAWLLPISTVKKIGGFDPIFFHYGEDDNYCQRILFHKLKIGVVPFTYIKHDSSVAVKINPPFLSQEYFSKYQKNLYIRYGDINGTFNQKQIQNEKRKILKMLLIALCTFNFFKINGLYRLYKIFQESCLKINESRVLNYKMQSNYL